MVILITDGVGERNLGMVTVFCCHDQNKMEASKALFMLHHCDYPEPSIVVIRRYTNTFTFFEEPLGSSTSMSVVSLGHFLYPIPSGPLMHLKVTSILQD